MSDTNLAILIEAIDRANRPINDVIKSIEKLQGLQRTLQSVGQTTANVGKVMSVAVTAPIVAGMGLAAKSAMDFESTLADVAKVTGLERQSEELAAIGNEALKLTRSIPMSATGMLQLIEAGAQLGVPLNNLTEFAETAAVMGTAFDIEAGQAGESMARLKNVFALTIPEVALMGDAMNHLSANTATSASELVEISARAGAAARTFGLNATQTTAVAAAFGEFAPNAESASTAINSVLPLLNTASKNSSRFQRGLATLGVEAKDLEAAIRQDAGGALTGFIQQLGALDNQARASVIADMFGTGIDAQVVNSLAANADKLGTAFGLLAEESLFAGSMQAEFNTKSETTANQMQLLRNNLTEVAITIGQALLPPLNSLITAVTPMIQQFAAWATENERLVQIGLVAAGVLAILGPALVVIGTTISAVATILPVLTGAFAAFGAVLAFLGGPVTLIIALVAGLAIAAYRLIKNWDVVGPFFAGLWNRIVSMAQSAFERFKGVIQAGAMSAVSIVFGIGPQMVQAIIGIGQALFNAGKNIMGMLAQGILAGMGGVAGAVGTVVNKVRAMLPGSPVKEGPLTVLNNAATGPGAKIAEMLAAGIQSGLPAIESAMSGIGLGVEVPPARSGNAGGSPPAINITMNISGVSSAEDAAGIRDEFRRQFEEAMESWSRDRFITGYS